MQTTRQQDLYETDRLLREVAWNSEWNGATNAILQQQLLNLWVEWAKLQPRVKIYCVVENDMSVSVRTDMRLIYRGHEKQAEIAYNALIAGLAIAGLHAENVNMFEFS